MAAYAALASLKHLIHDIENHHSPPISLDKQQLQSLIDKVSFLLEFLQGYTSSFADIDDEADPLEIRIADATYAAEDVIESYIVNLIKLRRSTTSTTLDRETDSGEETNSTSGEEIKSISGEEDDSREESRSNSENDSREESRSNTENDSAGEELRSSSGEQNDSNEETTSNSSEEINHGEEVNCREEVSCINLYEDLHYVLEEMDFIKKVAMKIDAEKAEVHDQVSASSDVSLASSSSTGHNTSSMVCSDDVLLGIMEKLVAGRTRLQVIPIVGMGGIGKTTLAINIYAHRHIKEYFDICVWATISQQYNARKILCQLSLSQNEDQSEKSDDELGLELYQFLYGRRFLVVMDDMWSVDAWDEMQRFFPNNDNGSRILVTTRLSQLSSQLNNNYSLEMQFLDEVSSWDLFSKTVFGKENCPCELENIGKEIVKNCRGLPLSIVVVGGLLKKMEHTHECWESITKNLTSVVNLENDKHCLRLLKTSYNHLPVYLKPCFLYMGVFEEDYEISFSRLIKLWVSEGLLKPINGKSVETIAKEFFKDLVDRNLILISKLGSTGNIKLCKIHDLLRDLCLRESKKYGFYHVVGEGEGSPQGTNSRRRVVVGEGTSKQKVVGALQSLSYTRSVICGNKQFPSCRNFGLLRTLESYNDLSHYKGYINFQCVNVRHLAVTVYSMSSSLSSLYLLWNLHTLTVYCYYRCFDAFRIWIMPQLRHINFTEEPLRLTPPSNEGDDIVVMENLETLKGVKDLKCGEDMVKRIPNVKKLKIRYCDDDDDDDDDSYCLSNIKYLRKLESLDLRFDYNFREFPASVHELTYPHSLKSLNLEMHRGGLKWEEMLENIGSLPLLQKLKLEGGRFPSGKWEIVEGQFPSLKYLSLVECHGLKHWMTQESSVFPCLEKLLLHALDELEEIPSEIGDIPTLQKITLSFCSESAVMCVKEIVEEQVELQGEQLTFHVKVWTLHENESLLSLAGPNIEVSRHTSTAKN